MGEETSLMIQLACRVSLSQYIEVGDLRTIVTVPEATSRDVNEPVQDTE
jgi:hypothetical protein